MEAVDKVVVFEENGDRDRAEIVWREDIAQANGGELAMSALSFTRRPRRLLGLGKSGRVEPEGKNKPQGARPNFTVHVTLHCEPHVPSQPFSVLLGQIALIK